jgi:hypothetical protein
MEVMLNSKNRLTWIGLTLFNHRRLSLMKKGSFCKIQGTIHTISGRISIITFRKHTVDNSGQL